MLQVAVKLQKYAALNHLARSSTAGDPLSVRKWFLESGIPLKQLIPILETIYGKQGVALDLVRLYLQENSPAKIRGLINGVGSHFIVVRTGINIELRSPGTVRPRSTDFSGTEIYSCNVYFRCPSGRDFVARAKDL